MLGQSMFAVCCMRAVTGQLEYRRHHGIAYAMRRVILREEGHASFG